MSKEKIPQSMKDLKQWVVWKSITRNERATKLPFQVNGSAAKSNDPTTWTTFDEAWEESRNQKWDGAGFVFSENDAFCGIDLDGCRNPETGIVSEWAKDIIKNFDSYTEVSPSGTGVKIFVKGKSRFEGGKKIDLGIDRTTTKNPGIEIYDKLRYFATTGMRLGGVSVNAEDRQDVIDWLCEKYFVKDEPKPTKQIKSSGIKNDLDVIDRARKYLSTIPPSIAGSGGHNQAFYAACRLCLGFNLCRDDALSLLFEWNAGCQPPWSQRELEHKIDQAQKQPGERGYLRDAEPENWTTMELPSHQLTRTVKPQREIKATTLEESSYKYLETVKEGKAKLISLGLPDVDYAIGGGVEFGELVVLAARPSQGKSAVALQCIHTLNLDGIRTLIISEEMSAIALGKRSIQFATSVPEESWQQRSEDVHESVKSHFGGREKCFIVESCGTMDRAEQAIREHVGEHDVRAVAVDYAQVLRSEGKSRYDQVTNTSIALRNLATELNILVLLLCQLNRSIEGRQKWTPVMSDLKESGQIEQDADVILFLCWPHRFDPERDKDEYFVTVGKNRNRAINTPLVKCKFNPTRQKLEYEPVDRSSKFEPTPMPEKEWPDTQTELGWNQSVWKGDDDF